MSRSLGDYFFSFQQQAAAERRASDAEDEMENALDQVHDLAQANRKLRQLLQKKKTEILELNELLSKRNEQVTRLYNKNKAFVDEDNYTLNRFSESDKSRLSMGVSRGWIYIVRNSSRQFLKEFKHTSDKPWGIDEARVYNLVILFSYGMARDITQGVRHIFDWLSLSLEKAKHNESFGDAFAEALQEQVIYHRQINQNKNVYELAKARTREILKHVKYETNKSTLPTIDSLRPVLPLTHYTEFEKRIGMCPDLSPFVGSNSEYHYKHIPGITDDSNLGGHLLPSELLSEGICSYLPYPDLFELGSTIESPKTPKP